MAKLYFYYSAMNAGKTTTLLQSAHNYRERGMRVAIMTPRLDDRAGTGVVASRIGLRSEGIAFERTDDLDAIVRRDGGIPQVVQPLDGFRHAHRRPPPAAVRTVPHVTLMTRAGPGLPLTAVPPGMPRP